MYLDVAHIAATMRIGLAPPLVGGELEVLGQQLTAGVVGGRLAGLEQKVEFGGHHSIFVR